MSGLEAIKARAKAYAEHGTPGLRAPQDRAELLAILERVELLVDNMATFPGDIPPASPGIIIRAEIYGGGL